jgi:hypothetical protein
MVAVLVGVGSFLPDLGRNHHDAAVPYAALGDDVVGEMLHLCTATFQGRHFHAVVIVEMDVKRGERKVVMAMIILNEPPR